jgi:lysozyme family protein
MTISSFDDSNTSEIQITSLTFRNDPRQQRLESYPKQMLLDGREYTFVDSGIRYLVRKGQELVKLFDMSDGQQLFRLRLDGSNHWTLVGMKATA